MNRCYSRRIAGGLVLMAGLLLTMRPASADEGFARAADYSQPIQPTSWHSSGNCAPANEGCTVAPNCAANNGCCHGSGCNRHGCNGNGCNGNGFCNGGNGCRNGHGGNGFGGSGCRNGLLDGLGKSHGRRGCGNPNCPHCNGHDDDDDGVICCFPLLGIPLPCLPGIPVPGMLAGIGGNQPVAGCYGRVYAVNPYHHDFRDGAVYAAQGYNAPMSVPLAPNVNHVMNYGWGIPSSRMTPVSRVVPSPYAVPPTYTVPQGYIPAGYDAAGSTGEVKSDVDSED